MKDEVEVSEINLVDMVKLLWSKAWIICISTILAAVLFLSGTVLFVVPQYQAEALLYVNNSSVSSGSSEIIVSGEIDAAKKLVDVYVIICELPSTLETVIQKAGLDMSVETLAQKVTAEAVNDTEVFQIKVTDSDPQRAARIANIFTEVLPDKIASIVDGSSVRIMNYATVPTTRSSPSYTTNTLLGAVVGLVLSCGVIVVIDIFLDKVKNVEMLTRKYKIPVLAEIPDLYDQRSTSKKYRYYGYSQASQSVKGGTSE